MNSVVTQLPNRAAKAAAAPSQPSLFALSFRRPTGNGALAAFAALATLGTPLVLPIPAMVVLLFMSSARTAWANVRGQDEVLPLAPGAASRVLLLTAPLWLTAGALCASFWGLIIANAAEADFALNASVFLGVVSVVGLLFAWIVTLPLMGPAIILVTARDVPVGDAIRTSLGVWGRSPLKLIGLITAHLAVFVSTILAFVPIRLAPVLAASALFQDSARNGTHRA